MDFFKVTKEEDLKVFYNLLVDNFYEDPLYCYIFDCDATRKRCLAIFFSAYIRYLGNSAVLHLSEDKKGCGVVYSPKWGLSQWQYKMKRMGFIKDLMPLMPICGVKGYRKCLKTVQTMSSDWIDYQITGDYLHLDLMVVDPSVRGQGYFKKWMQMVFSKYAMGQTYLTLETQNPFNIELYKRLGFEIVEEIDLQDTDLRQYCMVKFPQIPNEI